MRDKFSFCVIQLSFMALEKMMPKQQNKVNGFGEMTIMNSK